MSSPTKILEYTDENHALQPKYICLIMKTMHSIHKEYLFVIMTMMNSNQKNSIYENAGNYSWGGGGRDVDRVQVTDFNMLNN